MEKIIRRIGSASVIKKRQKKSKAGIITDKAPMAAAIGVKFYPNLKYLLYRDLYCRKNGMALLRIKG
jgi:hypothetical protein